MEKIVMKSKIFTFNTSTGLNKFLGMLKFPFFRIDYGAIETGRTYSYRKKRVLITAEHAETRRIPVPDIKSKSGKETFIPVGDKNTDKLAKMAAQSAGGAYILSRIPRTDVDMSRSPGELRRKTTLSVKVARTKDTMTDLLIHRDQKKIRVLKRYQKRIANLNPEIILSYHGMGRRHASDITLGFGPNKIYIGGRRYAVMFTKFFRERLIQTLEGMGLNKDMKIRRSKYVFLGRSNFVLKKNVRFFNEKYKKKRMGVQVEFNLRGRTRKSSKEVPKLRYQVAAQVLANCAMEFWSQYKQDISASIDKMNAKTKKTKEMDSIESLAKTI